MADKAPFSRADKETHECNISWLLRQFDAKNFTVRVAIDRLDKNCNLIVKLNYSIKTVI